MKITVALILISLFSAAFIYWYISDQHFFADNDHDNANIENSNKLPHATKTRARTITGISSLPSNLAYQKTEALDSLSMVMNSKFDSYNTKEQGLIIRALKRLIRANETLISSSTPATISSENIQTTYKQVDDYLIEKYGVQLWTAPILPSEKGPNIPKLVYHSKAKGIHFDLKYLHRHRQATTSYEYWVALVDGPAWAGIEKQQIFYLVKQDHTQVSQAPSQTRKIMMRTKHFSPTIEVFNTNNIQLPVDDPNFVEALKPWHFTQTYTGTQLDSVRTKYVQENNTYKFVEK